MIDIISAIVIIVSFLIHSLIIDYRLRKIETMIDQLEDTNRLINAGEKI